jgi:uncharacterized protein (TIGR00251 family)
MHDAGAPRPCWLAGTPGDWSLLVHVQPGASHSEPAGEYDGCLKLRIAAPPIEGRANEALRTSFAERLGVPRSAVRVEHGNISRRKRILVTADLAESELAAGSCIEGDRRARGAAT